MEIKSISQKIFRSSPSKIENNGSHTNPFGVSFKGNMISADVFETVAKKSNLVERFSELATKATNKGKMVTSAIVGSMGDVTSAISTRLNSVVSFGRRIGEGATKAWSYLNTKNLKMSLELVERRSKELLALNIIPESRYNVKNLKKLDPIGELEAMFQESANAKIMEAIAWITIKN